MEHELESLQREVAELRSRLDAAMRRVRRIAMAFGLSAIAVLFLTGAYFQQVGRFSKAVEVSDGNQRLRAVLFADDGNNKSGMEIRDPVGNMRLKIGTNQNDDPYLLLRDARNRDRLELGIAPNGDSYLIIRDGQGVARHSFAAKP